MCAYKLPSLKGKELADIPDEELWVCEVCDAHYHVDSVGDRCPSCGTIIDDDDEV